MRKKLTITDMKQLAEDRGGRCLSSDYINNKIKLAWQCSELHEPWLATANHIKRGSWCPYCVGLARLAIADIHELAEYRGGKCLSVTYSGASIKLQWQCSKNHDCWWAKPNDIKNGSWCPHCNINYNEECCRKYLNQLFDAKFVICRPVWLKNPETGGTLQLDGYCSELNLAFEYNGEQHYQIKKFDPNISDEKARVEFVNQQKRDKIKIQLSKENNVKLIIIPYWENKNIEKFILSQLKILNIDIQDQLNLNDTN